MDQRHRRREDRASERDLAQRSPKHREAEATRKRLDDALDLGLVDTFPASDPVAVTQPARSARDKQAI
ncbi:MAG TPA: hypothetical protein VGJ20_08195 [Xanthobacteraceae bacterium]